MSDVWITTHTGKKFHHLTATVDDVDIIDIAHALSLTCRYAGHCSTFYSVAEHCVRLCDIMPESIKAEALMHDAAEAYLLDMPTPLKDMFPKYRDLEAELMEIISAKYGIIWRYRGALKLAEYKLLATEVRDIMPNSDGWYLPEEPLATKVIPWTPGTAEHVFLNRFELHVSKGG